MRAAEFIKTLADVVAFLDNDDDNDTDAKDPSIHDPNPVFVPPLQQHIELAKAEQGKDSPIIKKLTQDETEHNPHNPIFRTR